MEPLLRWRGQVALVTGASSGIGRAIALDLGRLGLRVALTGRRAAELESVAAEIRAVGGEALVLPADQTRLESSAELFAKIHAQWEPVAVLVNSAGMRGGETLLGADLEEIRDAFALNVLAAAACMREFIAARPPGTDGAIINISSMTAHRVMPGVPPVYAATKHALRVLTDGLRSELATAKSPVKVSLISPGLVDTPWHRDPAGVLTKKGAYPYETLQPEDIVAAVRYILSAPPRVQIGDIMLRPTAQNF
jgi:NADP-dependent 3-hydroxy acid dehydrogenase YdfG